MNKKVFALILITFYIFTFSVMLSSCSIIDKSLYTIEGNYVYFGSYPQSRKEAGIDISNITNSQGYYLGADKSFYARIQGLDMKPNVLIGYNEILSQFPSMSSGNYYYKIEPIKWRILERQENKLLLLSEVILDSHNFDWDSNNYEQSDIRVWLNDEFYNSAFTEKEQALICTKALANGDSTIYDNVFLLSSSDMLNNDYGFNNHMLSQDTNRVKLTTSYSRAKGVSIRAQSLVPSQYANAGAYYLRSANGSNTENYVHTVYADGVIFDGDIDRYEYGVVPALVLDLDAGDNSDKAFNFDILFNWFSSQHMVCNTINKNKEI